MNQTRFSLLQVSFFVAVATLLGVTASVVYADAPEPGSVSIADISYRGSGCPQGSVAYNLSPDAKAFTVLFDNFIVEAGEENQRDRKRCNVNLDMNVPSGWSFALFCVEFRGFADLEEGLVGEQTSRFRFGRSWMRPLGKMKLEGSYADDYQKVEQIPLSSYTWTPCDSSRTKRLQLQTEIAITPDRGHGGRGNPWWRRGRGGRGGGRGGHGNEPEPKYGVMTVDSIDGELAHHYGIAWRRCETEDNRRGHWHRGGRGGGWGGGWGRR